MFPFIVRTSPTVWCWPVTRSSISSGSAWNASTRANTTSFCPHGRGRKQSVAGQLVGEQRQREASPRERSVGAESVERLRDHGQAVGVGREALERRVERLPPGRCVELRREPLGGDRVELELAVRVAACGENE